MADGHGATLILTQSFDSTLNSVQYPDNECRLYGRVKSMTRSVSRIEKGIGLDSHAASCIKNMRIFPENPHMIVTQYQKVAQRGLEIRFRNRQIVSRLQSSKLVITKRGVVLIFHSLMILLRI